MAKKTTYLYFILDETGSMQSIKQATIDAFNEYLENLKKDKKAKFKITLITFNSKKFSPLYNMTALAQVTPLNEKLYQPDNATPLYDTIGRVINTATIARKNKDRVLVTILTDGLENDSKEYTREAIFGLITERRKAGWEFVFLGANQDSYETSANLGINPTNVSNFDPKNIGVVMAAASSSASLYSRGSTENLIDDEDRKSMT